MGIEHANGGQLAQPLPPSRPVANERGALSPTAVSAGDLCPNRSGKKRRKFVPNLSYRLLADRPLSARHPVAEILAFPARRCLFIPL